MSTRQKILFVFGTRPEAIKIAPVFNLLRESPNIECEVCVTAQHRHMLDQVLKIFKIKPDYDLDLMKDDQDLFSVTTSVLMNLKELIQKVNPQMIVVQGDTTTAFVVSLAAFYLQIPVAHIEAGLRTYNKKKPFPEEINRRMISLLADINFAPTDLARNNLLKEGVDSDKVFVTGNTVVDSLMSILDSDDLLEAEEKLNNRFDFLKDKKRMVLITGHRRESFGEGFENICLGIKELAEAFPDDIFVYPVHLNPNVQEPVNRILKSGLNNVFLIEPLDYLSFLIFMKNSYLVLTDSGGVQEEAISFKKPILIMREVTERPEGIEIGVAKLVGSDKQIIIDNCKELLLDSAKYSSMTKAKNPYGDGKAAGRIKRILKKQL